jgi:hypothetical protein
VGGVDGLADERLEEPPVGPLWVQCPVRRGLAWERSDERRNTSRRETAAPEVEDVDLVVPEEVGFDGLAVLPQEGDEAPEFPLPTAANIAWMNCSRSTTRGCFAL